MAEVAILIDGSDEPVRGGRVEFPAGAIRSPRRPLTGLAIAFVTALVTMGAMGPQPPENADAVAAAILACTNADAGTMPAAGSATTQPVPAPTATQVPWWLLPQLAVWVDPATGRTMELQARAPARLQVVDHHSRDR